MIHSSQLFTFEYQLTYMAKRILLLLAHPKFEKSRVNKALIAAVADLPGLTVHDLYEAYPDFNVDVAREQALLLAHDVVIWHHPIYWYSCPPLLKQWIDLVLTIGWAYGKGGDQLSGKWLFNAVTSGGSREVYQPEGRNRYTLNQFLAPFEQTAWLCQMTYLPPFAIQGTHGLSNEAIIESAQQYKQLLQHLQSDKTSSESLQTAVYLNDLKL